MKKGFGIFFIVLGTLNIIRSIIMAASINEIGSKHEGQTGRLFIFGICVIGLGIWMVISSKKKPDPGINRTPIKKMDENTPR